MFQHADRCFTTSTTPRSQTGSTILNEAVPTVHQYMTSSHDFYTIIFHTCSCCKQLQLMRENCSNNSHDPNLSNSNERSKKFLRMMSMRFQTRPKNATADFIFLCGTQGRLQLHIEAPGTANAIHLQNLGIRGRELSPASQQVGYLLHSESC